MPIKIKDKQGKEHIFQKFADAVDFVIRTMKLTKEKASAFVASLEKKQGISGAAVIDETKILTPEQIKELNKDGLNLDASGNKMYILRFLWNNEWNDATDPAPFRIKEKLNDKLRAQAIDMPYIVPEYGVKMHIRDKKNPDSVSGLLELQAKYTVGPIKGTIESASHNFYGVIEVWPEFQGAVRNNLFPPFTSPTFNIKQQDVDGVNDADFLNLQAVPESGYTPTLAGIKGMCIGGIKQCMEELKVYGAAGHLKEFRKDQKLFSNTLSKIEGTMSSEEGSTGNGNGNGATPKEVVDAVKPIIEEALKPVMEELKVVEEKVEKVEKMEEAIIDVIEEVATEAEGVDETKIKKELEEVKKEGGNGEGTTSPPVEPTGEVAGAAGKHNNKQISQLQIDLKGAQDQLQIIKKEREAEKATIAHEQREKWATSIVESELKLKSIEVDKKEERTKYWMELKDEDDNLVELKLTAETLASNAGKIVGASGFGYIPELGTDESNKLTNSIILEELKV